MMQFYAQGILAQFNLLNLFLHVKLVTLSLNLEAKMQNYY